MKITYRLQKIMSDAKHGRGRNNYKLLSCTTPTPPPAAGDLEPFVKPLVGPGKKQADLLLKHTRTTLQPDGSRIFSPR